MNKKFLCLILTALLLLSLCGCGSQNNVGVIGGADSPTEIIVIEPDDSADENEEPAEEPAAEDGGFAFVYKGVHIAPDALAAPLVEALGEPISYFEAPSCAFEGLDKIYTYPGFELDTYPVGDVDYVSAVILKDDSVATPEGLMIGSAASEIESALGEATSAEATLVVYDQGGSRLRFILSGSDIVSIEYISLVSDAGQNA